MAVEDEEDDQQKQKRNRPSSSKEASEDSIPALLREIVLEILSRLPVESLLRCRSVCKLWRSLISDRKFVKSHLNLAIKSDRYERHGLIYSSVPKINLKSFSLAKLLCDKSVDAVELDYPLKHPHKSVWIVGSCHGLLCIAIEEDILFIWNPTTRRSNRLPHCGVKLRSGWYLLYGFGHVEATDDYKVVGIFCVFKNRGGYNTQVKVYSIKCGNWKKIGEFPNGIPLDDSGKFLNGALHWAASQDFGSTYSWTIVSLDLETETYGEVLQPGYNEGDFDLTLGVLGEWLCVLCNYHGRHADVWAMKVYGVKESWTRLVSIPYVTDPGRDQFSVPLCISNDGKFLLQFGSKLVLYDPKDSSFSEIQNLDACLEAYTYVESLVAPDAPIRAWR